MLFANLCVAFAACVVILTHRVLLETVLPYTLLFVAREASAHDATVVRASFDRERVVAQRLRALAELNQFALNSAFLQTRENIFPLLVSRVPSLAASPLLLVSLVTHSKSSRHTVS